NMQLFRCVQLIRRTQKRNFNTLFFCNISHDSLADSEFFDDFIDFVAENDDLASMLVFEFRQEDVQDADSDLLRKLGRLADLGFRFSLDGVTHFNMNYSALATAQFRFLRIDAELLLGQLSQGSSEVDIRDLKRRLDREGIDLIVQKIEKEEDLRELLDFNIDFGQGYLFGEPRLSRDD
ncbi:MAG: EAL domain-containing protein, partial [Alphaproteobacteria bacterium]